MVYQSIKYNIIILFIHLILFIYSKNKKKLSKVCICAVGKRENNNIIEFVEHYYKYKIDKIFLYDNNEINEETFIPKISKYISSNFVEIINIRGKKYYQTNIYQKCYEKNYKNYKWFIFIDIDEFIYLKNYSSIKKYLQQEHFKKCQSIYLNWLTHTNNKLYFYDNRSLFERFKEIKPARNCFGKSIMRGNMSNIKIKSLHVLDPKINRCDCFGNIFKQINYRYCIHPDYKNYFIDHFRYKSIEEYIDKINKGDCLFRKSNKISIIFWKFKCYLRDNNISLKEKIFLSKKLHLN